ncbi:MAG TPA: PKD domain-containing protein, partial [Anaerolineales bacterium]|nr:PKD domain-containing protein [Anaerolineales bacterium]
GPAAGSEPETQAIQNFVLTLFPDQRGPGDGDPAPASTTGAFVTLHSFSQVVLYPWGWTGSPSPNATQLATLGRKFGYFNGYAVCQSDSGCMYATNGTSDDWAYGNLGIASYTFEIGTEFFESCSSFESMTYPDNLPALIYAFKAARHPYIDPLGPDSTNLSASPAAVEPGAQVLLTATADDTRYNSNGQGTEPTQNIGEARYSIDSPSWITGTVTIPMDPMDGAFDEKVEGIQATIDTTGLTAGRHTIFVESKDVAGNWGVPFATFLYIIEPGVSPVLEGYIREGGTNLPLAASLTAGLFNTTTDPATGFYSMTVISGTYDIHVTAQNFSPGFAPGVVAQNYQTVTQDFLLYPYCEIFNDDVENGNQGWTPQTPWGITTSSSHSTTHSWTDSPAGNYGNNLNTALTSQTFDLSGYSGVTLSFWHKYVTEQGWDFGNVEYSPNGTNWYTLETYSGSHNYWSEAQLQIPELDGQQNAKIRFRLTSDTNTVYDGWYVDDISIRAGGPGCIDLLAPTAEFTSNSPVEIGQPAEFSNLTTGTAPISYTWDFGDGLGTSTETNPSYTYADLGTYSVTLEATNLYGTDTVQHTLMVNSVNLSGVNLTQVTPGPIFPGQPVQFSADLHPDNATMPYDFTVDFGDGYISSGVSSQEPLVFSHTYANSGSHAVQISVQNAGMTIPVTDSLVIHLSYQFFLPMTVK